MKKRQLEDWSSGLAAVAYVAENGRRLLKALGETPTRRNFHTYEDWIAYLGDAEIAICDAEDRILDESLLEEIDGETGRSQPRATGT